MNVSLGICLNDDFVDYDDYSDDFADFNGKIGERTINFEYCVSIHSNRLFALVILTRSLLLNSKDPCRILRLLLSH